MNLSSIKKKIKKDPPGSLWIYIHRKIGLVFTWVFVNFFPKIKPNQITISMLFFNIISSFIFFEGIINDSVTLMLISFIIFSFSLTLDCVDGNLARIYSLQSYKGVYYDRIVHNISHPLLLVLIGYGISTISQNHSIILLYFGAALFSEFTPLEIARKDVKVSFINQLLFNKSKNFSIQEHNKDLPKNDEIIKSRMLSVIYKYFVNILKIIFSYETMFIFLIIIFAVDANIIIFNIYIACFTFIYFIKGFTGNDLEKFFDKLRMIK